MKKTIFKGKLKVGTSWVGIMFQKHDYKDKFSKVRRGETRSGLINTKWGQLSVPNYKDMNKFGNKKIKIIVEMEE
jgi:hypothetical protein